MALYSELRPALRRRPKDRINKHIWTIHIYIFTYVCIWGVYIYIWCTYIVCSTWHINTRILQNMIVGILLESGALEPECRILMFVGFSGSFFPLLIIKKEHVLLAGHLHCWQRLNSLELQGLFSDGCRHIASITILK